MFSNDVPVVCLMGPTASGKTALSLEVAQQLSAEIISVDSMLVYRFLDIGTAKPTPLERALVPHHLIDVCDPVDAYSVGKFCSDVATQINSVISRGRLPILVGGTMMYFRAFQRGLASQLPTTNEQVRKKISKEIEEQGLAEVYVRLKAIDPITAFKINCNDSQRIQRALEVYEITGRGLSEIQAVNSPARSNYRIINFIISPTSKIALNDKIENRFNLMLKAGLVEEVKELMRADKLSPELVPARSVGYRQVLQYLNGKVSYQEMIQAAVVATRQLAKRQLTWLRQWKETTWHDSGDQLLCPKIANTIKSQL
jgi:tRNA dimethylallyltransferase